MKRLLGLTMVLAVLAGGLSIVPRPVATSLPDIEPLAVTYPEPMERLENASIEVSAPGPTAPTTIPASPSPRPEPLATSPTRPEPTATEGWTPFSHWKREPNGKVSLQLLPEPGFRREGSAWTPIDPTVEKSSAPGEAATAANGLRPIRFGRSAADTFRLQLDKGPVTLSWDGFDASRPEVSADSVIYRDVAPDTDLRYRVSAAGIKEELILRSAAAPRKFSFRLADPANALGGVEQTPDGGYRFRTPIDGSAAIEMPPAVAYEESTSAHPALVAPGTASLALVQVANGYDGTIAVDPSWIEGKSFPVVLDPTISFNENNGMQAGYNAYSAQCSPSPGGCVTNFTSSDLVAGTSTGNGYDAEPARSFFKFNFGAIPPGSAVSAASLNLYTVGCIGAPDGVNDPSYRCDDYDYWVDLHKFDQDWDGSTTWDQLNTRWNASAFASLYQPRFITSLPDCTGCFWMTIPMAGQVQNWVNGATPNYGFLAKIRTEAYNIGGPGWAYRGSQSARPHPYLQITYTAAPGAPQNVTASAGNAQATVNWGAASTNGGTAIASYTVKTYTSGGALVRTDNVCGTCTTKVVTGLTNGASYYFEVYATNGGGVTGPTGRSNTVTPSGVPSVVKLVVSDAPPVNGVHAAGQSLTYTVRVSNPQAAGSIGVSTVEDTLDSRLLPPAPASVADVNSKAVTMGGSLISAGTACSGTTAPRCQLLGSQLRIDNFPSQLGPGQYYDFTFKVLAVGTDRGCATVDNAARVTHGAGFQDSAPVAVTICDPGLGLENWWSYVSRELGPQADAKLNVANGNLVVQQLDSTPVPATGGTFPTCCAAPTTARTQRC